MSNKIAAVVALYNPDENVVANISSYKDHFDIIYLMDNSPEELPSSILNSLSEEKFFYFHDGRNNGISKAINLAAEYAIEKGFEWLLTMDQDSKFDNVNVLIEFLEKDLEKNKVGIYSPFHDTKFRICPSEAVSVVESVMTSGNIVNLSIFKKVGGLDEKFFIDRVDHDYCSTLIERGFFIKQINSCTLQHNLGAITKVIGNKEITNHSPLRRYYITRNSLYYLEKHAKYRKRHFFSYAKGFLKDTLFSVIFEKDKMRKVEAIVIGLKDYFFRVGGEKK